MLRAYISKNTGNLMWEDPVANTRGVINRRRLIKGVSVNRQGQPAYYYQYIYSTGRVVNINMWRVFEAPRRKKKLTPTNTPMNLRKVNAVLKKPNSALSRAFRNNNGSNKMKAIFAVLNSNNLMQDLTINNLIKILTLPPGTIPANKATKLKTILVGKLVNNGNINNIQNASYEINFTNSQNARLANAYQLRMMATSG